MDVAEALAVWRLVRVLGRVKGRKRLQKIVHLLKSAGHQDFQQGFILHYFGPFSRELAAQVDFLCDAGLLTEEEHRGSYRYEVCSQTRQDRLGQSILGAQQTPPWTALAHRLHAKSTPFLEALSTLAYLAAAGRKGKRLEDEFRLIKPALRRYFDEAHSFAKEISLI